MPAVAREIDGIIAIGIGLHVRIGEYVTPSETGFERGIRFRYDHNPSIYARLDPDAHVGLSCQATGRAGLGFEQRARSIIR